MRYEFKKIESLQLEISSNCNASCPQCPRNFYGGKTVEDLPLITWTLNDLQQILTTQFVQQLKFVYFCGTYGDPMINKAIADMCFWLKKINSTLSIGIHTNGSLGHPDTYKKLTKLVNFISFGIDGLEDTNAIYRRNTNWKTIIKNVKIFIENGGNAHWVFIVFVHIQHQVKQAEQLSQQLNFKTFNIKKTSRFFNKSHQLIPMLDVLDNFGNKIYKIKPPTIKKYLNKSVQTIQSFNKELYVKKTNITCTHLIKNEIYIGADGYVFPCGWLHDRLYGVESQYTSDRNKIRKMMKDAGGDHIANCFETPLEQIVDGIWFDSIQNSWSSKTLRFERCAWLCGDSVNFIKEQNEFLKYEL